MSLLKNPKLLEKLKEAGWYENRKIYQDDFMEQIDYPVNVFHFRNEFGGLTLKSFPFLLFGGYEVFKQLQIFKPVHKMFDIDEKFSLNEAINWAEPSQEYYYSVLIGMPLYHVANPERDSLGIYMDELNNFYEISDFVTFRWIADNAMVFFEQFLDGFTQTQILDEDVLKWIPQNSNPKTGLKCDLPINPNLSENPFP